MEKPLLVQDGPGGAIANTALGWSEALLYSALADAGNNKHLATTLVRAPVPNVSCTALRIEEEK